LAGAIPGPLPDPGAHMPLTTVILDIEGTTSATAFVVERLYPYSAERFAGWIAEHGDQPEVARAVAAVRELIGDPAASQGAVVAALHRWLRADQKITPLKTLQGQIWADGFARGELVSHFFPDVIPALRAWHACGLRLYVFSSGSVAAQQAWFGHTAEGDLRPLLAGHFDTENAGPKREVASYRAIAAQTGAAPGATVFLSDVNAELDAARAAGWHTVAVRRPGEPHASGGHGGHPQVVTFGELDLSGDTPVLATPAGSAAPEGDGGSAASGGAGG
jgi:enolase-phosphatase E1